MATLDRRLVRRLAGWTTGGLPVTSVYLNVDGRLHPRREDYLSRLEDLLRRVVEEAGRWERDGRRSVCEDAERIRRFVRDDLERKGVRGLALFSSSGADLWEAVRLPQPVRDRADVGERPRLIPLEAMLEQNETFCTVVADRERARLLVTVMGEAEEVADIQGEFPGWHDQGGWAQARYQRHLKDHLQRHLRRVADALLDLDRRRPFDRLVLAGTEDLVADLERELHDYVRRKVVERTTLPITAGLDEVAAHALEVERRLEARREAEAVDRLVHEVEGGTGRAVAGLGETLSALEEGRVETLVVDADITASGVRCLSCGHLDAAGSACPACGAEMEKTDELVEEAVESALRQRCRVETVAGASPLRALGGIGALLRF